MSRETLFGLPEDAFHFTVPRKGLITKTEIRVLSLSRLDLAPGLHLWDIGAGSGSVGIEAARLVPTLTVTAIEKDQEDFDCLIKNVSAFGLDGRIRTIHGKAPEKLPRDPRPDRVFIGGTGGRLSDLLDLSLELLPPDGKVVINLATFENISEVLDWTREKEISPEIWQIQTGRGKTILGLHRIEAMNPVVIISFSPKNPETPSKTAGEQS